MLQIGRKSLTEDFEKFRINPKKYLGQNFLVSDIALQTVIKEAEITREDTVLEVGPGTGLLTERLLKAGAKVVAVEKDKDLFELLKKKYLKAIKKNRLVLVKADFLDLSFPSFLENLAFKAGKYKVVANLPYQITSPFLERIIERDFLPQSLILTLQKEVVEKIAIEGKKKSSLGVLIGLCAKKIVLKKIFPPNFFYPQPKVSSALLLISDLKYPEGVEIKKMRSLIRAGFAERRKKLKNNLKKKFPLFSDSIEKFWLKKKLNENLRAEQFQKQNWIDLCRCIFNN